MNRKLALGLGLLALLCILAALSGWIAPHEAGYSRSISTSIVEGKEVLVVAPEPPGRNFVFGSDPWGHDLFSDMVHGLPWTLGIVFFTALSRCILGLGAGLCLGSSHRAVGRRRGFSPLSALPSFIIAAFVLFPVTVNSTMPSLALFLVQGAVLILVEIVPITAFFGARTAALSSMAFVEAARVSGADRPWLVRHHLLPHIAIDFVEALPLQALSVASMIGKLGIANLFIGGTIRRVDPEILLPAKSEWLGLLGCHYDRMLSQPWLFLAPFGGWLLILACTGLLAAGLREGLEGRRRMV